MGSVPGDDQADKPRDLAEGKPAVASIVQGAEAFELIGQIPELKANVRSLERALDRQQDEMIRSFSRAEDALKSNADRYEKALAATEDRLVKAVDYQRGEIKELGDKINGINWKLALAAGAVMVGSAVLTSLLPVLWKTLSH